MMNDISTKNWSDIDLLINRKVSNKSDNTVASAE